MILSRKKGVRGASKVAAAAGKEDLWKKWKKILSSATLPRQRGRGREGHVQAVKEKKKSRQPGLQQPSGRGKVRGKGRPSSSPPRMSRGRTWVEVNHIANGVREKAGRGSI